tara:strand:- start:160 stop:603 length:444 start_codon:yes stop_codon:yes gene_type:complete
VQSQGVLRLLKPPETRKRLLEGLGQNGSPVQRQDLRVEQHNHLVALQASIGKMLVKQGRRYGLASSGVIMGTQVQVRLGLVLRQLLLGLMALGLVVLPSVVALALALAWVVWATLQLNMGTLQVERTFGLVKNGDRSLVPRSQQVSI